jgi:hypothetical protein
VFITLAASGALGSVGAPGAVLPVGLAAVLLLFAAVGAQLQPETPKLVTNDNVTKVRAARAGVQNPQNPQNPLSGCLDEVMCFK